MGSLVALKFRRTVDLHLAVLDNGLNDALLLKVGKASAGQGAVDLETIDEDGDGHQAVGLNILVELVGGGLVEDDGVLGLVLDLSLGPIAMGKSVGRRMIGRQWRPRVEYRWVIFRQVLCACVHRIIRTTIGTRSAFYYLKTHLWEHGFCDEPSSFAS